MTNPKPIAVIVGAGKTGRGFIARFAACADYQIVFIDKSINLVDHLNDSLAYTIHYFGDLHQPMKITGFMAAVAESDSAIEFLAQAKVIFTAIGEHNLPRFAPSLYQALIRRKTLGISSPSFVITCENGISPSSVLQAALNKSFNSDESSPIGDYRLSEGIVFCSTVEKPGTFLDIESEVYDELPFDANPLIGFHPLPGMVKEPYFKQLLKRKIYTYNCISACIAYLGAYKGYKWYADAANDSDIGVVIEQIIEPLNQAICMQLKIPAIEQRRFSEKALNKFKNIHIRDDIARNARHVIRKLGPDERLVAPALMIQEVGGSISAIGLVMAAALYYRGPEEGELETRLRQEGIEAAFTGITTLSPNGLLTKCVINYYKQLLSIEDPIHIQFAKFIEKERT